MNLPVVRAKQPAFKPVPIDLFVVKIVSRCNLNCSYCYMYNLGDETWRGQPKVMRADTVRALGRAVREHVEIHHQEVVCFVFHGGEPLLAGKAFFSRFVETITAELGNAARPVFRMQTNGTLLTAEWVEFLSGLDIGIGISLDGSEAINDRHRRTHGGRGSYAAAVNGISLALAHPDHRFFGSVLCVVDPRTDPLFEYEHFRALGLRGVDFLFPDATWDKPPPHLDASESDTPYADWLIPIFDAWFQAGKPDFRIRLFNTIIERVLGGSRAIDSLGGEANGILVVETDGGLEPVDVLKVCGDGFTKLDLNVLSDRIDQVYESPLARLYMEGRNLSETCQSCHIGKVCGGGYLPHRHRLDNGFANPSVYCRDLMKLISHIRQEVVSALPEEVLARIRQAA